MCIAADEEFVGLVEQILDKLNLVGKSSRAENRDERPLR